MKDVKTSEKGAQKMELKNLIKAMRKRMAASMMPDEEEEKKDGPVAEIEEEVIAKPKDDEDDPMKEKVKQMFRPSERPRGISISLVKESRSMSPVKSAPKVSHHERMAKVRAAKKSK